MIRLRLAFLFIFFSPVIFSQSGFLDSLLKTDLPAWANVLEQPGKYKLQIIYTQINRDTHNKPKFSEYHFGISKNYFYPASTVKLPVSLMALIKLEELNIPGLDRSTTMLTDSLFYCQKKIPADSVTAGSWPSIENYIKRMFLVSDNFSFARVYEFLGHDYAHQKLAELGYKDVRLFNRLDGSCPGDTAKVTPPVYFLNGRGDTIYKQNLTFHSQQLKHPIASSKAGAAHVTGEGKKVYQPKDFASHNYMHVNDLHSIMRRLIFNEYLPQKEKFPVSKENREFMIRQLGIYPRESDYPKYDKKTFYDSYKKYFLYASAVATIKQDSIREINIVGRAYGFLIDCAYIVDFKNNTEFLLTTAIYVNERNVVGGGRYQYDQVGLPFMRDLSWAIYNYERKRKKTHEPNLDEFSRLFNR